MKRSHVRGSLIRFPASSVLLAIEVVSDETVSRDRETKP